MLQTIFGLTVHVAGVPIAAAQAHALADRINAAALQVQGEVPAALSAETRRDGARYLAARGAGLRLPPMLERVCDEGVRAIMRLTLNAPPLPTRAERLVA